jgi:hypothetical protein
MSNTESNRGSGYSNSGSESGNEENFSEFLNANEFHRQFNLANAMSLLKKRGMKQTNLNKAIKKLKSTKNLNVPKISSILEGVTLSTEDKRLIKSAFRDEVTESEPFNQNTFNRILRMRAGEAELNRSVFNKFYGAGGPAEYNRTVRNLVRQGKYVPEMSYFKNTVQNNILKLGLMQKGKIEPNKLLFNRFKLPNSEYNRAMKARKNVENDEIKKVLAKEKAKNILSRPYTKIKRPTKIKRAPLQPIPVPVSRRKYKPPKRSNQRVIQRVNTSAYFNRMAKEFKALKDLYGNLNPKVPMSVLFPEYNLAVKKITAKKPSVYKLNAILRNLVKYSKPSNVPKGAVKHFLTQLKIRSIPTKISPNNKRIPANIIPRPVMTKKLSNKSLENILKKYTKPTSHGPRNTFLKENRLRRLMFAITGPKRLDSQEYMYMSKRDRLKYKFTADEKKKLNNLEKEIKDTFKKPTVIPTNIRVPVLPKPPAGYKPKDIKLDIKYFTVPENQPNYARDKRLYLIAKLERIGLDSGSASLLTDSVIKARSINNRRAVLTRGLSRQKLPTDDVNEIIRNIPADTVGERVKYFMNTENMRIKTPRNILSDVGNTPESRRIISSIIHSRRQMQGSKTKSAENLLKMGIPSNKVDAWKKVKSAVGPNITIVQKKN